MKKILILALLMAGCATTSAPTPEPQPCPSTQAYCYHNAFLIKRKLFVGILWRDLPPDELGKPDGQVEMAQRGEIKALALGILDSPEFYERIQSKDDPPAIKNQFYRGLLGREASETTKHDNAPYKDALEKILDSDEFKEKILTEPVQPIPDNPKFSKRTGQVSLSGRALRDDQGEFFAIGATLFSAARLYKFDRPKLERALKALAENGFDYIRALGTVNWAGREIDPHWEDYEDVIRGTTDLAYDKYGIRIQWTIFGDAQHIVPSKSERQSVVDKFLNISKGREEKIIAFELANEYWQNGFGGDSGRDELRSLTKSLNDRTQIIVAASSPNGSGDREILYGGNVADFITLHLDRIVNVGPDYEWRTVRQPWGEPGINLPASNNEPIGPGSSVACIKDPLKMASLAIVATISGFPMSVFHSRAGVGSQSQQCGLNGDQDISEMPGIDAFIAMHDYLPGNLPNWTRENHYWPGHPFRVYGDGKENVMTTDGAKNGCMRTYAAHEDNNFVVSLTGIKGTCELEPKRNVEFDIIDILSGQVIEHKILPPGERFGVGGREAALIKGFWR